MPAKALDCQKAAMALEGSNLRSSRADELGIDFEVMDANLDINKQTQQAEDFMTKGVDVLIMTPVNEEGVVPILRKAKLRVCLLS